MVVDAGSESAVSARRGRRFLVVAIVVIAAVVVAIVAIRLLIDDRSEAVPIDEVLANYRTSTTVATRNGSEPASSTSVAFGAQTTSVQAPSTTATDARLPPVTEAPTTPIVTVAVPRPGVYRYGSSGFEEIDALSGARHDYPAETTITVSVAGCGVRLRWDVLRERREEWSICGTPEGIVLQPDAVQYHEFFQQGEEEAVTCTSNVLLVPADPTAMPTTDQSCRISDDPWRPRWEVRERSTRTVDGVEITVTHVRMIIDDDDEFWEHTTIDWMLAQDGLPIEVTAVKESNSPSPIGDVVYNEQFHVELLSLDPVS